MEGNLTEEEQKELEKVEKENMKTIEDVYKSLIEDKEIQKQIEKIKSHEWVEVIEERDERKGKEDINRGQEVFD